MRAQPPSLKHFLLQVEARALYRDVLRGLKHVDSETAAGVKEAARAQFDSHAEENDLDRKWPAILSFACTPHTNDTALCIGIRIILIDGRHSLEQMQSALSTVVRR